MEPLAVDVPEAARLLSQDERTIWRWIASGALKSVKRGRSRRIRMDDLRAFNATRDDSPVAHLSTERRRRRTTAPAAVPSRERLPLPEYAL